MKMLSKSRLKVDLPEVGWPADAVEARIYTANMDFVYEAVLTPREGIAVYVDPGVYVIEARLPARGSMFVTAKVPAQGIRVELPVATNEIGRLTYHAASAREVLDTDHDNVAVWVRLWDPRKDDWVPTSLDSSDDNVQASIDKDRFCFEFGSVSRYQSTTLILEVGREGTDRRWFSLPIFREGTNVVLTGAALTQKGPIGAPLISTPAQRLDAILQLLADPAPGAPEELWVALSGQRVLEDDEDFLQGAEDYHREKVRDPLAAAAGALYLVRFEIFDKLHGWARNLADWFPWLADGAVAWAAQLLRDPDVTKRVKKWYIAESIDHQDNFRNVWDAAQAWLIHSMLVGPPIFTESVRQLTFGFDAVARHLANEGVKPSDDFLKAFKTLQMLTTDVRGELLVSAPGIYDPWVEDDVGIPEGANILEVEKSSLLIKEFNSQEDVVKLIYVVGPSNPDTDSVISAIALATLLNAQGQEAKAFIQCAAADLNPESAMVIERFALTVPEQIGDAAGKDIALVDFSDIAQGPAGLASANVVTIVDHHKMGDVTTNSPIPFRVEPVGCTCTILNKMFKDAGIEIPKAVAGGMLAAILSDTVNFKSPTCTPEDKAAVAELKKVSDVEDTDGLFMDMLRANSLVAGVTAKDLLFYDFKDFDMKGNKVGVGQLEIATLDQVAAIRNDLYAEMQKVKADGRHSVLLMLTDVVKEGTDLVVVSDDPAIIEGAFNAKLDGNSMWIDGMMSRKKQTIPTLKKAFKR